MDVPAEIAERRLTWARAGVLLLLAITVANAYLTRHCLAVSNTRMQVDLNFNNEQFGLLYGAFSLGYLICQVPGGWLGQRLGTRFTIPLLCFLWSAMTLMTGVGTSLYALIAARFGFGLAQAGLIPNQAQVIKDWFRETSRGSASAVIVTAMSVGSFAALWITSRLLNAYSWRSLLFSYAILGMLWSICYFLIFRSRPSDVRWLTFSETTEPLSLPAGQIDQTIPSGSGLLVLFRTLSFWALTVQMIFKAAGYNLLVTFFPTYLELAFEITAEKAGELTSWSLVAVVIGSLLGGQLVDVLQRRTGSKWISRSGVALTTLMLTAALMLAATYAASALQVAVLIAISSLLMGAANPCAWAATIDIGGKNTAVIMGLLNMGGALSGIVISPLVGRLIDHIKLTSGNWHLVVQVHAGFYLIAALCWLFVNLEQHPEPKEPFDAV